MIYRLYYVLETLQYFPWAGMLLHQYRYTYVMPKHPFFD